MRLSNNNTVEMATGKEVQLNKIENLDFVKLKMKLQDIEDGEGWTEDRCSEVEFLYRRFLKLNLLYPLEKLVPSKEIDIFWHYHILDTQSYISATFEIFGSYLHHYPYLGLFEEDKAQLNDLYSKTEILYAQTFNELFPVDGIGGCKSNCAGRCRN